MKKPVAVLLILLLLALGGCAASTGKGKPGPAAPKAPAVSGVTLLNPVGPLVIPLAGLAANKVNTGNLKIKVQYWKNNDEVIGLLSSKKAEFAVLPVTMAANMDASGVKLRMLGVHEWKVFYMVAPDADSFKNWESLRNQEVYIPVGKGSTVDLLLRSAIESNGMKPDQDVKIIYAPPQEIVTLFQSNKIKFAALPEPYVTLAIKGGQGQIVLDFQKYWAEVAKGPERLPVAGLFVRRDFYEKYPGESLKVAEALGASTDWYKQNVDAALQLSSQTLPIPAPVMKNALSRIQFDYISSNACQNEVKTYLQKMRELYPEGLKTLPDAGFYGQ